MDRSAKKRVSSSGRTAADSADKQGMQNPHLEEYERYIPVEMKPQNNLYHDWGHQAVLNYLIGRAAVKRLYPLVPETLVPLLMEYSDNKEDVEAAFKKIKALNEEPELFDSPQEKYRKIYGNYVREIEWCCRELRRYLSQQAYESLIIDSTMEHINGVLGEYIDKMKEMMIQGSTKESPNKKLNKRDAFINRIMLKVVNFQFRHVFNAAGWLVGDVEIEEFNFRTTELLMKVKDCLMLRAPRMRELPEQACLLA